MKMFTNKISSIFLDLFIRFAPEGGVLAKLAVDDINERTVLPQFTIFSMLTRTPRSGRLAEVKRFLLREWCANQSSVVHQL
jgi:hypothetical protein